MDDFETSTDPFNRDSRPTSTTTTSTWQPKPATRRSTRTRRSRQLCPTGPTVTTPSPADELEVDLDILRVDGATGDESEELVEIAAPADATDLAGAELLEVVEVDEEGESLEGDGEGERRPREPSPYDRPGDWYVVHTYAGYENKVKQNLASRVRSMNVEERIFEVVIPMEDVIEFKGGRKVVVQKKVFPGYLLVRMDLDDDSWYVVRNTPGVTGFVGSGAKPTPLSPQGGRGHPRRRQGGAAVGDEGAARGSSSRRASRCAWSPARSPTSTARSPRSTSTARSSRCS